MAAYTNSAEGGTVGATISVANSGGASGNAFTQVSPVGAPSYTFANNSVAHGSLSYRITGIAGDTVKLYLGGTAATASAARAYLSFVSVPIAAQTLLIMQNSSFAAAANVNINSSGKLYVSDAAGATLYTSPSAVTAGTWYRVELQAAAGTTTTDGTINFQYYTGDGTTALGSFASATVNAGTATMLRLVAGKHNSSPTLDFNLDDLAYTSGTTTPIGVYVFSNQLPIANAGFDQAGIVPGATVTLDGSGSSDADGTIASYSWTQVAGNPTVSLAGSGATRTFTAPATANGTTLVFGLVVTDNLGASSIQDTINVNINGQGTRVYLQNTAEGGTNGVSATTLNTGGASGPALSQVITTTAGTATFSNAIAAHGSLSYLISGAATDTAKLYFGSSNSSGAAARVSIYLTTLSGNQGVFMIQSTNFTEVASVNIDSTNHLTLTDAAGSTLYVTTATVTTNTWYRLELQTAIGSTTSNGTINFQWYAGDSTTAIETFSSSSVNSGTYNALRLQVGKITSSSTLTMNVDDLAYDTQLLPIGPYAVMDQAPTASAGGNIVNIEPYTTVTLTGTDADVDSTVVARTWRQVSGPAVTLSGTGATRTYTAPGAVGGATLVFGYQVTDDYGAMSDESTTTHTVLPVSERAVIGGLEVPIRMSPLVAGATPLGYDWVAKSNALVRRGTAQATELLNTSFDTFALASPMTYANYCIAMGGASGGGSSTVANTSIIAAASHGNIIRQHFVGDTATPATAKTHFGGDWGIVTNTPLTQPVDEATLTYDIRFAYNAAAPNGFDWVWGGKLPGLGGIRPGYGNPPTGGSPSPNGWSGRGMWITKGSYPSVAGTNEFISYIYDPTQAPGNYGQNRRTGKAFVADQWHTVTQYYKMNTIATEGVSGNTNGVHRVWFDGQLVYENTAQVFRIYEAAKITHLLWHMFYGGGDYNWAPSYDSDIDIDNLRITTP
ncbi:MAG: polysaccharide lyase [Candidatus Saccharimonadales bacterium]